MMHAAALCLIGATVLASGLMCTCSPMQAEQGEGDQGGGHQAEGHHRHKRSSVPSLSDRTFCQPGEPWPAIRVNTTQRLTDLRAQMVSMGLHAFLIYSDDAHGSEYPADVDLRRGFITGFSGSAGYAAVTLSKAAMWTDGRYYLEGEDALDCNWIFMKKWQPGVPSLTSWLGQELSEGQVVGADPFLLSNSLWQSLDKAFIKSGLTFTQVTSNPLDIVWTSQPEPPATPINALALQYAGRSWQDKVKDIHRAMEEEKVHGAYVVTSLDEVAWLFNLRASDIAYNPFFISYAVVEYYGEANENNTVRLYIYDKDRQLTAPPNDTETTQTLQQHLNTGSNGSCHGQSDMCVQVHDYIPSEVVSDIAALAAASDQNKIWITFYCNFAIFNAIPEAQRFQKRSYIALAKARKNPTEARNMDICYKRDSAVLVEFLAMLEKEIADGTYWTEVSATEELKNMRLAAENNRGLSFQSIAGSGPNGAVIHYRPSADTDRQLTPDEMFLLDSGGQYLECTTDTTRTVHFGTPTAYMIEGYTRVLMGTVDLARVTWPTGLYGRFLDILARQPLWAAGLDYNHGTGHGIGAYFSVHEGPGNIGLTTRAFYSQEELYPNMFFSDEPGFYEPGQFGVRLETVVMVEPADTKYNFDGKQFLHFKPVTLVPFEPKLIDYTVMSDHQIEWLNYYHKLCQDHIEPLLTSDLAKNWLKVRTKPYVRPPPPSGSAPSRPCSSAPTPLPSLVPPLLLALAATFTLLL